MTSAMALLTRSLLLLVLTPVAVEGSLRTPSTQTLGRIEQVEALNSDPVLLYSRALHKNPPPPVSLGARRVKGLGMFRDRFSGI